MKQSPFVEASSIQLVKKFSHFIESEALLVSTKTTVLIMCQMIRVRTFMSCFFNDAVYRYVSFSSYALPTPFSFLQAAVYVIGECLRCQF
jgi:hypothetical protein